jgi:preprotein translocase subunit SecA
LLFFSAIEAAFHSLQQQDNQVDVITSSPLLATAAVEEWRPFFAMVSLSVAHNGGPNEKPGKMRECYKADIVYGDLGRFRGDFLRHEFKGENTRGFIYDLFMEKMLNVLSWLTYRSIKFRYLSVK